MNLTALGQGVSNTVRAISSWGQIALLALYVFMILALLQILPYLDSRWGRSIGLSPDGQRLVIGAIWEATWIQSSQQGEIRLPKMLVTDLESSKQALVNTSLDEFSRPLIGFQMWDAWGQVQFEELIPYMTRDIAPSTPWAVGDGAELQLVDAKLQIREVREIASDQDSQGEPIPVPDSAEILGFEVSYKTPYFAVICNYNGRTRCLLFHWNAGVTNLICEVPIDTTDRDASNPIIRILSDIQVLLVVADGQVTTYSLSEGNSASRIQLGEDYRLLDISESGLLTFEHDSENGPQREIFDCVSGKQIFGRNKLSAIHELPGNENIRLLVLELPSTGSKTPRSEIIALNRNDHTIAWLREAECVLQPNARTLLDMTYMDTASDRTKKIDVLDLQTGATRTSVQVPEASYHFNLGISSVFIAWVVIWLLVSNESVTCKPYPIRSALISYVALMFPAQLVKQLGYSTSFSNDLAYASTSTAMMTLSVSMMLPIGWLPKIRIGLLIGFTYLIIREPIELVYHSLVLIFLGLLLAFLKTKVARVEDDNTVSDWFSHPRLSRFDCIFSILLVAGFWAITQGHFHLDTFIRHGWINRFDVLFPIGLTYVLWVDYFSKRQWLLSISTLALLFVMSLPKVVQGNVEGSAAMFLLFPSPFIAWLIAVRIGGYRLRFSEKPALKPTSL